MDVVYNVCDVAISGVFALYELELSATFIGGVFFECAVGSYKVSDGSDDIRFVVGGSMLCW